METQTQRRRCNGLGSGGPGYTVEAEIRTDSYIKKARLAQLGRVIKQTQNEEASGSQFYIVQGKVADENMLQQMEMRATKRLMQQIQRAFFTAPENKEYLDRLKKAQTKKTRWHYSHLSEEVQPMLEARMDEKEFSYTR